MPQKLRGVAIDNADPTLREYRQREVQGRPAHVRVFQEAAFRRDPGSRQVHGAVRFEKTLGQDGALARKGLVPLPKAEFEAMRKAALAGETAKADALTN